jgi:hypothetical protein
MATTKPSPIISLALGGLALLALYEVWLQGGLIPVKIAQLPIQGQTVPKVDNPSGALSVAEISRGLHPLLIESSSKSGAVLKDTFSSFNKHDLDALFARQEEPTKKTPAPDIVAPIKAPRQFDYFGHLAPFVSVQALAINGAVLNNKFYAVGESVRSLAYPSIKTGKQIYPLLQKVGPQTIYLENMEDGRILKIPLS